MPLLVPTSLHQPRVLCKLFVCLQLRFSSAPHFLKSFSVFGLGFGLSEGGSLPSGVGGVSSKAAASIFVPSISVPSRAPRSFWIYQIYRSSAPPSLSLSLPLVPTSPMMRRMHSIMATPARESTSASLRPKCHRQRKEISEERLSVGCDFCCC